MTLKVSTDMLQTLIKWLPYMISHFKSKSTEVRIMVANYFIKIMVNNTPAPIQRQVQKSLLRNIHHLST